MSQEVDWKPYYTAPMNIYLKVFDEIPKTAKCIPFINDEMLWVDCSGHVIFPTHWDYLDKPPAPILP